MIVTTTNAVKALWWRVLSFYEACILRATIAGLEDDLRILEGIQGYHEKSKQMILEEIEIARRTLHLITRKGRA